MGYSEIRCIFCAVSFNIGRNRRPDELKEAGWMATSSHGDCEANSGCSYIPNFRPDDPHSVDRQEDASYIYESENEEEAYEYESDDDLVDAIMEDDTSSMESLDEADLIYKAWLESYHKIITGLFPRVFLKPADPIPIVQNPAADHSVRAEEKEKWQWREHIAGPDCTSTGGYNGYKISAEEMKGCTSFQCLMEKPKDWKTLEDDEDFETESKFFLTGLGIDMPSRDDNFPHVFPTRHGADMIDPENDHIMADSRDTVMPFHTTCFEVYKQFSRQKCQGRVELHKLMSWWASDPNLDTIPKHPSVDECSDQWWQHIVGTEWLTANPVFLPTLPEIFTSVTSKEILDSNAGVFPQRACRPISSHLDPFSCLPTELSHLILSYLPSSDIANLRLVSRQFEQLPLSLFHSLIRREMPWLWEVWSAEPPSFWTTTTKTELLARQKRRFEHEEELEMYRTVIKEEMPELYDDWLVAEPSFDDIEPLSKIVPYNALPRTRTNWYKLYQAITRNWKELKGLQNRQRIWISIGHIAEQFGA